MNPSILIVEDEDVMRKTLEEVFDRKGFKVSSAETGSEALEIFKNRKIDIALLDVRLPDTSGLEVLKELRVFDDDVTVIVMTAYPEVKTAISAMKTGAYDYINKPFELDELKLLVDKALENRILKSEAELFRYEKRNECLVDMIGVSSVFGQVKELINMVAGTPKTSVLILGETGTGKELVANAIHCGSDRSDRPFIKVNCSTIQGSLLESELFGYEKGAFTDARHSKKGLFELADGGTIFLDEIGEMDVNLQAKLLQVLEYQTFRKVGGVRDITVDVRVVAATNRDLAAMVMEGKFREDIYYRLKVMVITLPPLRERKEDIVPLSEHFIGINNRIFGKNVKGLSSGARKILLDYPWHGNIRELKNIMERAMILEKGEIITPGSLPRELLAGGSILTLEPKVREEMALEDVEREHILHVLRSTGGNKSQAARSLGISRLTLREKLKKFEAGNSV